MISPLNSAFSAREFRIESGAQFQQCGDTALRHYLPCARQTRK
jgi:hypothetical protein